MIVEDGAADNLTWRVKISSSLLKVLIHTARALLQPLEKEYLNEHMTINTFQVGLSLTHVYTVYNFN